MLTRELLQGLFRYCLCLTSEHAGAEDLLQTSLEQWLRRGGVPEYSATDIRATIRQQFIDDCRRQQRIAFEPLEEHGVILLDETCLEELQIRQHLIGLVFSLLNVAEREVLYLWAVEGYSATEIGADLMQARGTILSRLHSIKQKVADASALVAGRNTKASS